MDIGAGIAARLDRPIPYLADALRWRLERPHDATKRVIDTMVKRGDLALDIGASRGLFSSRLLRLVGRSGKVHAFEPNREHEPRLRQLAVRPQLSVHMLALSDITGPAQLHVPLVGGARDSGLASLTTDRYADTETVEVNRARLDDLLPQLGQPDFVKCDVEGHEDAVLAGSGLLLREARPTFVIELEERHRTEPVRKVVDLFEAHGYRGWAIFPSGPRPVCEFDVARDQLQYLERAASGSPLPEAYVHNFLFVSRAEHLQRLAGKSLG